jgi:hypothetical protein
MPKLEDILGGRKLAMEKGGSIKGEGKYPFFFFCSSILECVAGKKNWKAQKAKKTISKSCATVSDEAFALLLMVNSWEKFEYLADSKGTADEKTEVPSTLFTEKKGRNRKMQGWSNEGIVKFNALCRFVQEDRKSKEGKEFEQEFLKYNVKEAMEKKKPNVMDVENDSDQESDGEDEKENGDSSRAKRARYAYNHLLEESSSDDEESSSGEIDG